MSSAAAKSKSALHQFAMPATAALLVGLGLYFALRDNGVTAEVSPVPESVVVTNEAHSDAADRQNTLAARSSARAPARSSVTTDPHAVLAQLRKSVDPAVARQARDRIVAELETQHQAEPVDAAWSAQSEINIMSASITPVVLQAGFKPQNVVTDCRSRTCSISASFTSAGDAEDWGDRVVNQMGGTLSQVKTTVIQLPDGRSEIRMYGARKQASRGKETRANYRT